MTKRALSIKQTKELSDMVMSDGEGLAWNDALQKFVPTQLGNAQLDDILVDDNEGQFLIDNNSGNPVLKG